SDPAHPVRGRDVDASVTSDGDIPGPVKAGAERGSAVAVERAIARPGNGGNDSLRCDFANASVVDEEQRPIGGKCHAAWVRARLERGSAVSAESSTSAGVRVDHTVLIDDPHVPGIGNEQPAVRADRHIARENPCRVSQAAFVRRAHDPDAYERRDNAVRSDAANAEIGSISDVYAAVESQRDRRRVRQLCLVRLPAVAAESANARPGNRGLDSVRADADDAMAVVDEIHAGVRTDGNALRCRYARLGRCNAVAGEGPRSVACDRVDDVRRKLVDFAAGSVAEIDDVTDRIVRVQHAEAPAAQPQTTLVLASNLGRMLLVQRDLRSP